MHNLTTTDADVSAKDLGGSSANGLGGRDTSSRLFECYNFYTRRQTIADPRTRRLVFRSFDRSLGDWLPPDRNTPVLDVGCGEGALLSYLKAKGYTNLHGFDLSPENVAICHRLGLGFVRRFDALEIAHFEPRERFGAIFVLDVIEHLPKQSAADFLEAARERLMPNGWLVVQAPNMSNLWAGFHLHYDLTHEWGLTERTAVDLFMLAGFKKEDIQVRAVWAAATALGRLREMYSALIHRLLIMTEPGSRPHIFTPNLIVRGVRC